MNEVWKDIYFVQNGEIFDYRGKYQISNFGRVKSLNYGRIGKEQIMKIQRRKSGYCHIGLCKNGKGKIFFVHRLVAFMFIENDNPIEKTCVNHKDTNPSNNYVSNLEWCTYKYNNEYDNRIDKCRKKQRKQIHYKSDTHPQSKKVVQLDLENNIIKIWNCMADIQRELGFNKSCICNCCQGKQKKAYGFKWKYFKESE